MKELNFSNEISQYVVNLNSCFKSHEIGFVFVGIIINFVSISSCLKLTQRSAIRHEELKSSISTTTTTTTQMESQDFGHFNIKKIGHAVNFFCKNP